MAGKIDEDVDAFLRDELAKPVVVERKGVVPSAGQRLESSCHRIRPRNISEDSNLELRAVCSRQGSLEEYRNRMLAQVRGDISNAKRSLRIRVTYGSFTAADSVHDTKSPSLVLGQKLFLIACRIVLSGQKQLAVHG